MGDSHQRPIARQHILTLHTHLRNLFQWATHINAQSHGVQCQQEATYAEFQWATHINAQSHKIVTSMSKCRAGFGFNGRLTSTPNRTCGKGGSSCGKRSRFQWATHINAQSHFVSPTDSTTPTGSSFNGRLTSTPNRTAPNTTPSKDVVGVFQWATHINAQSHKIFPTDSNRLRPQHKFQWATHINAQSHGRNAVT